MKQRPRLHSTPLPWLRLYTEFAFDPKVQLLSEAMQRRYVMLLCLAGSRITPTKDDAAIAFALRLSPAEVAETKRALHGAGLIDASCFPTAWDRRQRASDHDAAERKRRQREGERRHANGHGEVTDASRDSHVLDQTRQDQTRPDKTLVPSEPVGQERPTDQQSEAVERVFEHWQEVHQHPRAKLDDKRRRLIRSALRDYSEADLCQAISGYRNSPHHMGQNDQATVYDDIGLLLRDAAHIDAGLRFQADPPRSDLSPETRRIIEQTEGWMPPEMRDVAR